MIDVINNSEEFCINVQGPYSQVLEEMAEILEALEESAPGISQDIYETFRSWQKPKKKLEVVK